MSNTSKLTVENLKASILAAVGQDLPTARTFIARNLGVKEDQVVFEGQSVKIARFGVDDLVAGIVETFAEEKAAKEAAEQEKARLRKERQERRDAMDAQYQKFHEATVPLINEFTRGLAGKIAETMGVPEDSVQVVGGFDAAIGVLIPHSDQDVEELRVNVSMRNDTSLADKGDSYYKLVGHQLEGIKFLSAAFERFRQEQPEKAGQLKRVDNLLNQLLTISTIMQERFARIRDYSADHVAGVLNDALRIDPEGISHLISQRVPCSAKLGADDVELLVSRAGTTPDDTSIGALGFLNGALRGLIGEVIFAQQDANGKILSFGTRHDAQFAGQTEEEPCNVCGGHHE